VEGAAPALRAAPCGRPSTTLRALVETSVPSSSGAERQNMLEIYPVVLDLIRRKVRQGSLAKEDLMK
jgi:hypothetical protein